MDIRLATNNSLSLSGISDFHSVELALTTVAVNIFLGLPLNGYVMWLILRGPEGNLSSDFFSLNLSACEIMFALSTMWYNFFIALGLPFFLKAHVFALGLLFTGRPLFQCCICLDCYVGVVHPVFFLRCKPLRYRAACCSVVWLITLVFCIYSVCTYENDLYLYGVFVQYLLYFSVMLFSCFSVVRALKHPGPGEKVSERRKSNSLKRKAVKIILIIMIYMAINFSSYLVIIPVQCCLDGLIFRNILTVSTSIVLITGFAQPLLYLHRNRKFNCLRKL